MQEIYVSTDIESDGPIPGQNSMLSLGSAVFLPDSTMVSTFSANLLPLEGAVQDPLTMKWWMEHREALEAATTRARSPERVMKKYLTWLKDLPGNPVFVGYPTGFDFMFVYWYLIRFCKESPFGFSAIDMKTMAMTILGLPYRESTKKRFPKPWLENKSAHTHVAVEDAIEQGVIFCRILDAARRLRADWR